MIQDLVEIKDICRVEPFWESTDALVQTVEGKYYLPYIKTHPDFTLRVRAEVKTRLRQVTKQLPEDWRLVVNAGFRPEAVQQAMFQDFVRSTAQDHSDWTNERCQEHARLYIADPSVAVAPHTTGAAIDVVVYDYKSKKYVDMGSPLCAVDERAHLLREGLTAEQRDNQELLVTAMLEAGFAPKSTEWWHFTYGDQDWADFWGHVTAIYGKVEL